jgi:hypothetical protein
MWSHVSFLWVRTSVPGKDKIRSLIGNSQRGLVISR